MIYPSASSALYFVFAMGLTAMSMTKEEKKVKLKFVLAISFVIISLGLLVTKGVYLIMLNNQGDITLSLD